MWWDVSTGELLEEKTAHDASCCDVAFSPDSRHLISAGDQTPHCWDTQSRIMVGSLNGHSGNVTSVAYDQSGKVIATGSIDGTVRLWDRQNFKELAIFDHGVNVYDIAFSPNGQRLATACDDNTIRLWDVARHEVVAELNGHADYVHAIAFSPDGTRIVSASGDKTLRIWDTLPTTKRVSLTGQE